MIFWFKIFFSEQDWHAHDFAVFHGESYRADSGRDSYGLKVLHKEH